MKTIKTFLLISCALLCLNAEARRNDYSIDNFEPRGAIYVQAKSDELLSCANEKLRDLNYSKETELLIAGIANATGNPGVPVGIREMLFTALFEITKGTNLFVQDHAVKMFENVSESSTKVLIAGAQVDFTEGGSGRAIGGGLFTKYFGIGIGRGAYMSLLTIDLRLINDKRRVQEVASLSTILKRLDKYAETEGAYKEKGLHLNWGRDSGESLGLAQRLLVNFASVIFVESIVGEKLTCGYTTRRLAEVTYSPAEQLVVQPRSGYVQKRFFPKRLRSKFKCKGPNKMNCDIWFNGNINSTIVAYTERAFRRSFSHDALATIGCKRVKSEVKCAAKGDVTSFSPLAFKENLYGS